MAVTDEHVVRIAVDDEASKAFDAAARSADKYDEATEKAGRTSEKFTEKLAKVAASAAFVKVALIDSVKAFSASEAASGRLERSILKTEGSLSKLGATNAFTRKNFEKFGYSIAEQDGHLQRLADTSGSVETAMADLSLAMDISAADNIDLARAVEVLRKVRNGEVEEVKLLTGVNKDFAESLGKIKDPAERAARTMNVLTKEYKGASEELTGTEDKTRKMASALDEAQESAGRLTVAFLDGTGGLVNAVSAFFGVIRKDESLLDKFILGMDRASSGFKHVQTDASSGSVIKQAAKLADVNDGLVQRGMTEGQRDKVLEFIAKNYVSKDPDISNAVLNEYMDDVNSELGGYVRMIIQTSRNRDNRINVADVPEPGPNEQDPKNTGRNTVGIGSDKKKRGKKSAAAGPVTDGFEGDFDYWGKVVGYEKEEADKQKAAEDEAERLELLEHERDVRDQIAELKMADRELDAEMLRISESNLTNSEKELAVQQAILKARDDATKKSKLQAGAYIAGIEAMSGAIGIAGEIAGEEVAARRVTAGVDALVLEYKALEAYGRYDYASAATFQLGAIQAAAVATGAIGGGGSGGGGGGKPSAQSGQAGSAGATSSRENAKIFAEEFVNAQKSDPVVINNNLEFKGLGRPTVEEQRTFLDAVGEESSRRVGGGRA